MTLGTEMDWERFTQTVVAAATTSFGSLMAEKAEEHFYAFGLYTDECAETVMPSANSVERYEAKRLFVVRGDGAGSRR